MDASNTKLIIAVTVLLILLVFYIIAKVKSKRDELVLTANGWDMAMLLICPVAICIASIWDFNHPLNTAQVVCLVIAGLCLVGTIIMSIVHNQGKLINVVISILAKLFIIWLTAFVIFLLIAIFIFTVIISMVRGHDNDDEYILLKYDHALRAYVGYKV